MTAFPNPASRRDFPGHGRVLRRCHADPSPPCPRPLEPRASTANIRVGFDPVPEPSQMVDTGLYRDNDRAELSSGFGLLLARKSTKLADEYQRATNAEPIWTAYHKTNEGGVVRRD